MLYVQSFKENNYDYWAQIYGKTLNKYAFYPVHA